jgi:hypothetical protein
MQQLARTFPANHNDALNLSHNLRMGDHSSSNIGKRALRDQSQLFMP